MKIKQIRILGFKSFMDKIDISFPMGISAIVGPNGCGKSNIVDAVRWAMGEQSAKQLRGRNMEDIICNGSGDYKPLGMAEVSLVFENGDGSFPTEYAHQSEVSVTRRLYRSGESEYLINNVPCRLKDIQEIFMDTGLGNKTYSVIGQGRIGSVIDQKPEETRVMLEEAAGITKYRRKVEESRRKIELTKGNLQRVEDILGEIERQMRSLKYQASKARRFKNVSQEIQRLELTLNAHAYEELKEESGHRVKSTEDLVQEEVALSTKFSSVQAKTTRMQLEMEEKDKEISRVMEAYLVLKDEVNKKESALDSLASQKEMQVEMEGRLGKEKEDMIQRLTSLEEERARLKEKVQELQQDFKGQESEIWVMDKRLRKRRELLNEVKQEYERAKERVNTGLTKTMSLNQESGYLNRRINEITDSCARIKKEQDDVNLKTEKIIKVSERKNATRQAWAEQLDALEEEIFRGEQDCDELEQEKKDVERELKLAEADLNVHQSRLSSLRSLTDNFEGYKIGVRTIMKATDLEARREGRIMGLVADVIQVDPKYEQAVEAVLSDTLQYIIVESQKDGKEAVDYLKLKARGRSSFVPITELNGERDYKQNNGFPLLRDLVSVPDSYKPLINVLLGNAALVEDLDQAISAWKQNGRDQCLVTPEGDMVDHRGVISGGKLTSSSRGLLARKREIKELQVKVKESEGKAKALETKLKKVSLELERKTAALDDLIDEKSDYQEKINDLDRVIFRLGQEMDQLEKLSNRISEELEKRGKEQNRHEKALSRIQSELKLSEDKRKKEEEYLHQKEVELKESEEEFEQIRSELEKLKLDHRLSQEEERGLLREIERIEDFIHETHQKVEKIEEDISQGKQKYQELLKSEEILRAGLEGFHENLEKAKGAVNEAEQDRNQFQAQIREEEKKAEDVRAAWDILREKINTAKLEQSEIRFRMNNLVDVVREKFNLNLLEIYKEYIQEDFSELDTRDELERKKKWKENMGEVNLTAIQEHEALKERRDFMTTQREDLLNSIESLEKAIRKINRTSLEKFRETFDDVDRKLKSVFPILFNGGTAGLRLTDPEKPLESGVLVEVRPPGKKLSHMGLLSGGEKALVAMALLFSLYLIRPSPFCLLDEVDAPLDEANIDRFNELLKEIRKYSQIILVTHNRRSMEIVDRLYGVTMEKAGISKMVSVDLQDLREN
ncbi:MAG: chromosome segregation protein SMC [Desulfobacteraceae bacterium]|jgi:chromosome segregation protein